MFINKLITFISSTLIILFSFQLQGCAVGIEPGAAQGVSMARDRRTAGTIVEDQSIELQASRNLSDVIQNNPSWKKCHISAMSYNTVVLLVGQVPNNNIKQEAEALVAKIPKVQRIYNELKISPPAPITVRSKDSWITTQIKGKMIGSKEMSAIRVKVKTEQGVVYLMGLTTRQEELLATEMVRDVPGVEKVIQIFEHV